MDFVSSTDGVVSTRRIPSDRLIYDPNVDDEELDSFDGAYEAYSRVRERTERRSSARWQR